MQRMNGVRMIFQADRHEARKGVWRRKDENKTIKKIRKGPHGDNDRREGQ
jgi:hypothetical protein